jgi:hypothetical protein
MVASPVLSTILLERSVSLPAALLAPSLLLLPGDGLLLCALWLPLLLGLLSSLSLLLRSLLLSLLGALLG